MKILAILSSLFLTTVLFAQEFKYKSHYKDTSSVKIFISSTVFCDRKEVDSSFMMRHVSTFSKENFAIYYDKNLTKLAQCFFIKNDTAYGVYYYRNGQKKKEDRSDAKDSYMLWFYSSEWCENGQLTSAGNPNEPTPHTSASYYCNGQKKFEAFFYSFHVWGTVSRWYENGKLLSQEQHTEFDKQLIDDGKLESKLLGIKYWDDKGNPVEFLDIQGQKLNSLDFPMQTWGLKQFQTENDTVVAYSTINGKYGFSTEELKNKIYETTIIKKPKCKYGVVYVNFVIDVDGKITYLYLEGGTDKQFKNSFIDAIIKLDKWKPVMIDGKPAKIVTALELESEKIKPENIFKTDNTSPIDCSKFKVGKFIYKDKITSDSTIIERTTSKQVELDVKTGKVTEYGINWSSNYEYELNLIPKANESEDRNETITVRVVKTTNNSYEYVSNYKKYIFHNTLELLHK